MTVLQQAKALIEQLATQPGLWATNVKAAENLLRAEAEADPTSSSVLTCLGAVLSDAGKHREAVGILKAAVRLGSVDQNTFFNLGVAEINSGVHEEAMGYFKQARQHQASPITWKAYFDPQGH